MARVVIPDNLVARCNGEREVEVDAANYKQLLEALEQRFPGVRDPLMKSSVAIDGQIYQDAFLEPISPNAEVFFLPRIEGG